MKRHHRLISMLTIYVFVMGTVPPLQAKVRKNAPILATVGFRTQDGVAERQTRGYLQRQFQKSGRVKVVSEKVAAKQVKKMHRLEQKGALNSLRQAQQEFARGKKLYDRLEIDPAIAHFSKAVRGYREGIAALQENKFLLASHLYLGMSLVIRGRVKEGSEYIRQMIVLNPWREKQKLPSREFPPKIVKLHRDLTQKVLKGPRGKVTIQTSPPGATVFFDGVKQRSTPVELEQVPAGQHFVTIEKTGFRRFSTLVDVKDGETKVNAPLETWDPLAPQKFDLRNDPDEIAYLTELGEMLGARILVLGDVETTKEKKVRLSAQLFDTHSREFSKVEAEEVSRGRIKSGANKLYEQLMNNLSIGGGVVTWLDPNGDVPGLDRPDANSYAQATTSRENNDQPLYEKWWFWTIVGAVAIGGGGAALLLLNKSEPDYNILSVSNPFAP